MPRDLTHSQYLSALNRHGFKPCGLASLWVEHPDFPNTMFGTIYNPRTSRIQRRATVAKVIKDLDRARRKERQKARVH